MTEFHRADSDVYSGGADSDVYSEGADMSAMLSHPHLSEPVTKGPNSSITVGEHTNS
jgi:hypothetical protein